MQMKNDDELDLMGADGEVITVEITQANGCVNNYVLNGQKFEGPGSFTLDKAIAPVFKLLVTTIYKTATGASCEITVTGSAGGDTSIHDEVQAPGETFDAAMYTFTIV